MTNPFEPPSTRTETTNGRLTSKQWASRVGFALLGFGILFAASAGGLSPYPYAAGFAAMLSVCLGMSCLILSLFLGL